MRLAETVTFGGSGHDRAAELRGQAEGLAGLWRLDDGRGASSGLYSQLAVLAYVDGNTRQSQLAEDRALALAPKRQHKIIQNTINQQRKQIDSANISAAARLAQQNKTASTTLTPGG